MKNKVCFGSIKRNYGFVYHGKVWKRVRGCFAIPLEMIGTGHVGIHFKPETLVEPWN